jgi:hypothetical protein
MSEACSCQFSGHAYFCVLITHVVDETVLGGVVLGLEGTEESLLGTKDLDSRGRELGKVHERTGVRDEAGTNKLADKGGEVGGDSLHTR